MRNQTQHLISHNSATIPSPVSTPYLDDQICGGGGGGGGGGGTPKYWGSERVPHSKYNTTRRQVNAASALLPFNCSGRTLPSKWDDAERWITSPVNLVNSHQQDGVGSKSVELVQSQSQRRMVKSKSGPLGPHMYGNCSPLMPVLGRHNGGGGGGGRYLTGDSPLLFGSSVDGCGGRRRSCPGQTEEELASARDWLEMLNEPRDANSSSPDERSESNKNPDFAGVTREISRRDMGTQMLPPENDGSSVYSSPSVDQLSPASSSSLPPPPISASNRSTETEGMMIRDVKVDKEVNTNSTTTTTRRPRRHRRKNRRSRSLSSQDFNDINDKEFLISIPPPPPPPPPPSSNGSTHVAINNKLQREEAKINAWENHQKAKAEAAIRKIEMKLEKKRSNAVNRILKKVRTAERKAEKMRIDLSNKDGRKSGPLRRTTRRIDWLCWKIRTCSIRGCISCKDIN